MASEEERDAAAEEETKGVHLLLDNTPVFCANAGPIVADLGTGFYGATAADDGSSVVLEVVLCCTVHASDYPGFVLSVGFRISIGFDFGYEFSK